MKFSDYIVYVDESGDHSLGSVNAQYPMFTLAFCIFKKSDYIDNITPKFNNFKAKYWGHCDTVLHEHDIRKSMSGDWSILSCQNTRNEFIDDLSGFMAETPFHIVACVVDKNKFIDKYHKPKNPYEIAMLMCMERLNNWLIKNKQSNRTVQIQFEARGKKEDSELELEFRRVCDNVSGVVSSGTDFSKINYQIRFLSKKSNATGLQISDLVARPIGVKELRPSQANRAFAVIESKFLTDDNNHYRGIGLKTFP